MINFSINKNLFLQALNTTKRAISHKNAIPILSTIKIDVTNEGITLIGSNGQISIENFISVNNENITTSMVDSAVYFDEAKEKDIQAVPVVFINGKVASVGEQTLEQLITTIVNA